MVSKPSLVEPSKEIPPVTSIVAESIVVVEPNNKITRNNNFTERTSTSCSNTETVTIPPKPEVIEPAFKAPTVTSEESPGYLYS